MQVSCVADRGDSATSALGPAELIARYSGRVPRYTSYPTAAQFVAQPDDAQHRAWLAGIDSTRPVSLYHHIPFCDRLCWYCGCHTRVVNTRAPVASYVKALVREIEIAAAALPARLQASAVHFGGGTPNMLDPADLDDIFGALRRHFDILPGAEIAAELDPGRLSQDWVKQAAAHGLNRASLGVQDFHPAVQEAINRPQSYDSVAQCVGWLRAEGVCSINLDLMYGLPHQSVDSILDTVRLAVGLAPDRIALFGYAHVPWMKPAQNLMPQDALPEAAERFDQQNEAGDLLETLGYRRIGLDHFARTQDTLAGAEETRTLHRNFQGYTTDDAAALIGFGASAISKLPGGYAQNASSVPTWRAAIEAGRLPTSRGVAMTADDARRADVIENLMCLLEADLVEIAARHAGAPGRLLTETAVAELARMEQDGLVQVMRDAAGVRALRVTTAGRPFVRNVCTLFDAYLDASTGRHSQAV
jgi:oxygen-independent coproporphyrinogen-3 oxidase